MFSYNEQEAAMQSLSKKVEMAPGHQLGGKSGRVFGIRRTPLLPHRH